MWSAHSEEELHTWFSSNCNVEVHAYVKNGKYCVVNNTYQPQDTTVYTTGGEHFDLHLEPTRSGGTRSGEERLAAKPMDVSREFGKTSSYLRKIYESPLTIRCGQAKL